jgi:hypothetical protein
MLPQGPRLFGPAESKCDSHVCQRALKWLAGDVAACMASALKRDAPTLIAALYTEASGTRDLACPVLKTAKSRSVASSLRNFCIACRISCPGKAVKSEVSVTV